jgi:hypothetical protein
MKQRAVVICLVLVTTMAIASCSKAVPSGITVHKTFTPLISPAATMIAGLDLEALKLSPLYSKYRSQLDFSGLDKFSREFGVDPRRDISQLLYVSDEKKQYFLVRGTFRGPELERTLQNKGFKAARYKGFNLLGDARNTLALQKGPVAVIGPADTVRAAIDTEEGGQGEVPEEIAERLRSMPKGDQVWLVSRNGLPFASAATRTDIQSALSNIVGFVTAAAGSLGIDTGAHLQAALRCSSPEGTTRVNDALRAMAAIGRLSTKDNEASLLKIYDAVKIERTENTVRVNAQLAGAQVEELVGRFAKR